MRDALDMSFGFVIRARKDGYAANLGPLVFTSLKLLPDLWHELWLLLSLGAKGQG